MTEAQKAAMLANSEARTKLYDLESQPEPDSAAVEKAAKEYRSTEEAVRTSLAAEDGEVTETTTDDGEHRERREVRSRARLSEYVTHAVNGTTPAGAEAELSAAYGCKATQMPIAMLAPAESDPRREIRAVSPGPAAPQGTQAPIPYVFSRTRRGGAGRHVPDGRGGREVLPRAHDRPAGVVQGQGWSGALHGVCVLAGESVAQARDRAVHGPPRRSGGHAVDRGFAGRRDR